MSCILYWSGILDPQGLTPEYEQTIAKILARDYQGLSLEKLTGHNVYSVRVNRKDRLLFTIVSVNGKHYFMLLDVVLNHEYAKSRFLKPNVLKHYLELNGAAFSEQVLESGFEKHEGEALIPQERGDSNSDIQYTRVDFFNHRYIFLNEEQIGVLTKTSLPLIISGSPGSGKSCLALLILGQYLKSHIGEEAPPLLYLTESEKLAKQMERAWTALPIAQGANAAEVQFKSYQQLLQETVPEIQGMQFVDKNYWEKWIKDYSKKAKKIKDCVLSEHFFSDAESIYQEFRVISGYKRLEDYKALGNRESLFQEQAEREWLFSVYESYQKHLKQESSIHPAFYSFISTKKFKCVVVDEAQDLSLAQLECLFEMAINQDICYFEDIKQSLSDNKSKVPFLKKLMHMRGKQENYIILNTSYRCPEAVAVMANALAQLKSRATGYGQQDITISSEHTSKGCVQWIDEITDKNQFILQQDATSSDFAVVTSQEFKIEAQSLLNTPLIFTPDEIKGLEYPHIMVYRPFDTPIFKEMRDVLGKASSETTKKPGHKAKKNQGKEEFGPSFNAVYTAFTRATQNLYIVQKPKHELDHIIMPLQHALIQETTSSSITNTPKADSANNWFEQVKILLNQGHIAIAKEIYLHKLNKTPEEFETFIAQFLEKDSVSAKTVSKSPEKEKQIEPKQSTTVLIKQEKTAVYLKELLKNPSVENLSKLFQYKKVDELLFKHPFDDGICLFAKLFFHKTVDKTILIKLLNDHLHKFDSITASILCQKSPERTGGTANASPLCWLSVRREGHTFLKTLFKNNVTLKPNIKAKDLCAILPNDCAGTFTNTTSLYWLLNSQDGLEVLKILFKENNGLIQEIKIEDLCRTTHDTLEIYTNKSPLFMFSIQKTGCELLKLLFENNVALVQNITAKDLCQTASSKLKAKFNTSPLYWLSNFQQGRQLLKFLFEKNLSLVQDIKAEDFYLERQISAEADAYTSPFYWLSSNPEGWEVLKILFNGNQGLTQEIKIEDLCRIGYNAKRECINASVLYWISISPQGCKLLKRLFENNVALVQNITAKDLCQTPLKNVVSPFYHLSHFEAGRELLKILFGNNATLIQDIKIEDLCQIHQDSVGTTPDTSVLYLLSGFEVGCELLKILFENNATLIQDIKIEDLCQIRPDILGIYPDTSALYRISGFEVGCELLKILFENNTTLIHDIKIEDLCQIRPDSAGIHADTSVLYWLSGFEVGCELLKILFENNTTLIQSLKAEDLYRALSEKAQADINLSPLWLLSSYQSGCELFKFLFENNEALIQKITIEDLCRTRPKEAGIYANTSLLYSFSFSPQGCQCLLALFNRKPTLMQNISTTDLCRTRPEEAGTEANTSPLYKFSLHPDGLTLLNTLFEHNPKLMQDITEEDLFCVIPKSIEDSAIISPLSILSGTSEGRKILTIVCRNNPSLARIIDSRESTLSSLNQGTFFSQKQPIANEPALNEPSQKFT